MENYFQNILPKISGSEDDHQISIFGCPQSFLGRRGHANFATLLGIQSLNQTRHSRSSVLFTLKIRNLRSLKSFLE